MLPTLRGTDTRVGSPVSPVCLNPATSGLGDTVTGPGRGLRGILHLGSWVCIQLPKNLPLATSAEPDCGHRDSNSPATVIGPTGPHKVDQKLKLGDTALCVPMLGSGPEGRGQPPSRSGVENEAERIPPRRGGTDGLPVAFDPTVLVSEAQELPMFSQQVLPVNLLGLKGPAESDCLAVWAVSPCLISGRPPRQASHPWSLPQKEYGSGVPSTPRPELGMAPLYNSRKGASHSNSAARPHPPDLSSSEGRLGQGDGAHMVQALARGREGQGCEGRQPERPSLGQREERRGT